VTRRWVSLPHGRILTNAPGAQPAGKDRDMADDTADLLIENQTSAELTVGDSASLSHTVTQRDIDVPAASPCG